MLAAGRAGSGLHASSSASSNHVVGACRTKALVRSASQTRRPKRQATLVRAAQDEQLRASAPIRSKAAAAAPPAPQPTPPPTEPPSRFAAQIAQRQSGNNGQQQGAKKQQQSSWDAKEANGGRGGGADYLFELGMSDYNTNVDAGQNVAMIDYLFTGNVLGHKTDIADGSLRGYEMRSLSHLSDGYYIAPQFMDKVAMHIIKNFLVDAGSIPDSVRVPLILGIWGHKGTGKSFQTELVFKKLGLEPIIMSAGELEDVVAGRPGRLIRERYRKAADISKVRGKLSCLMINDLDAGIGRFGNTQVTVNNQIVVGTLMNICDHPNKVSVYDNWREEDRNRRIPIIVTGNDFSKCYAPLVRDGRMEKFFWEPTRMDLVEIVHQMYQEDNVPKSDIEKLLSHFGGQGLDFFGALRSSTYDAQIRDWVKSVALERSGKTLADDDANMAEVGRRLLKRDGLPVFEPVDITLDMMVAEGERLQREQQQVMDSKLSKDYYKVLKNEKKGQGSLIGLKG